MARSSPTPTLQARHRADLARRFPEHVARLDWSRDRLEDWRTRRLRALVGAARERSPWHAARLSDVDVERLEPESMGALPTMTKDDLMEHFDEVVTAPGITLERANAHIESLEGDAYLDDRFHVVASGGSSGRRGVYAYDWDAWATLGSLVRRWGVRRAERSAAVPGSEEGLRTPGRQVVANVFAAKASHLSGALSRTFPNPEAESHLFPIALPLEEIVAGLNRVEPTTLAGYPSAILLLASEARAGRLRIAPASIWTCGEPLLPEVALAGEQAWGVEIEDVWGMSEGAYALTCGEASGMHLPDDLAILEPVDEAGRAVADGTAAARFFFTNLYNSTTPLIRYEVTDEVTRLADPCPCGSAHARIASVMGRLDDVFRYPGGVSVHPLVFRSPLGREPGIVEYRVTQTAVGAEIELRCDGPVDLAALGNRIEAALAAAGVEAPRVALKPVDGLGRQDTGKLKRFVPLPGGGI